MKKIAVCITLLFCWYVFIVWYSPYDANKTIGGLCAKAEIGEKLDSFRAKLGPQELKILKKFGPIEEAEYRAMQYATVTFSRASCTIYTKDGIIVEKKFLPAEELIAADN